MIEDAALDKQTLLAEIDRVINDMVKLRARLSAEPVMSVAPRVGRSFGMWADRADMRGMSTTEWLDKLRREQWSPRDCHLATGL